MQFSKILSPHENTKQVFSSAVCVCGIAATAIAQFKILVYVWTRPGKLVANTSLVNKAFLFQNLSLSECTAVLTAVVHTI